MATAVTSMRIPTELNERYSRLAKETGRSRSFYVNEALQEAIDRFSTSTGFSRISRTIVLAGLRPTASTR